MDSVGSAVVAESRSASDAENAKSQIQQTASASGDSWLRSASVWVASLVIGALVLVAAAVGVLRRRR
ncbi:hypothetical protein [Corynebacterium sp. CCM 9203]|uniref:hypothetical protein n=1 Tax=Corynebacterium sp. CCM 9203 TaxID=3057615 RepID=UPI00352465C7